jgi:hypothetical protein
MKTLTAIWQFGKPRLAGLYGGIRLRTSANVKTDVT